MIYPQSLSTLIIQIYGNFLYIFTVKTAVPFYDLSTLGYEYSQHSGAISGYQSLLTVFHDMDLAVYTAVNGPLDQGSQANTVIHYQVPDIVWGLERWLNDSTACTFPRPWQSRNPKHSQHTQNGIWSIEEEHETQRWFHALDDDYEAYEGTYGHFFFGNITVTFEETTGELRFLAGRVGQGRLDPVVEWDNARLFQVEFDGPLDYFHVAGSGVGIYPPIAFQDLRNDTTGKPRFQAINALAWDPLVPPLFERNLQWEDFPGFGE